MLAAAFMMSPMVYAEETEEVLTLKMVKERAVKYSPEVKKQEVSIELARIAERDARVSFDIARANYQETLGRVAAFEQAMRASKLAYEMAQYSYDDSKLEVEKFKKELEYNAERMYLNLLELDNVVQSVEETLKLQRDLIRTETLKLQLGLTIKYQYEQQRQAAMDVEKQLQLLYNSQKALKWQLNRMIGRDLNAPVKLAPVTFQPIEYGNQQEVLEKAQEELLAISQFNRTIEDKHDYAEIYKTRESDKVEKLKFEIDQTKLLKADVEYSIQLAVNNAFDNLEICKKDLVDTRAKFNMVDSNYRNQEKLYELGLISALELKAGKTALKSSKNAYEKAVHNYYLAARKLQLAQEGILAE
jgi:outer membrane protein TolC